MTDRYDRSFQWHAEAKGWDWRDLKAQAIAESCLDPDAVSKAGAMGLAQVMPQTWRWIWRDVLHLDGIIPSPFDPEASIEAQAVYMGVLLLTFGQNWRKAYAAFNWGPGRVRRVVTLYGGDWDLHLPAETAAYLKAIERARAEL